MLDLEIDCPPGQIRPNFYLELILSHLSKNENNEISVWALNNMNSKPFNTNFGEWSWNLKIEDKIKKEIVNIFITYLSEYHQNGLIRYAYVG
tara:strand:- start:90 stop:365 length:276 start_codon:yes stop_codon:yes gene_type:complete